MAKIQEKKERSEKYKNDKEIDFELHRDIKQTTMTKKM